MYNETNCDTTESIGYLILLSINFAHFQVIISVQASVKKLQILVLRKC